MSGRRISDSSGRRPTILVVEDDEPLQRATSEVLEDAGYLVRAAADGERALKAAESHRPALILLDLSLPDMDGWSVLEQLRARGVSVPVVLMTAHTALAGRALEAGATAAILKPFDIDDLLRATGNRLEPQHRGRGPSGG